MAGMPASSRFIGVTIDRPASETYAFASAPENLPRWASGLGDGRRNADGSWTSVMDIGEVTVTFAPKNTEGILDHDVRLPDGTRFHNPMRVTPNGDGCDVVFVLVRQEGVSDEAFEKDAATIEKDLLTLKSFLETP
jgi:hypothetical protein